MNTQEGRGLAGLKPDRGPPRSAGEGRSGRSGGLRTPGLRGRPPETRPGLGDIPVQFGVGIPPGVEHDLAGPHRIPSIAKPLGDAAPRKPPYDPARRVARPVPIQEGDGFPTPARSGQQPESQERRSWQPGHSESGIITSGRRAPAESPNEPEPGPPEHARYTVAIPPRPSSHSMGYPSPSAARRHSRGSVSVLSLRDAVAPSGPDFRIAGSSAPGLRAGPR